VQAAIGARCEPDPEAALAHIEHGEHAEDQEQDGCIKF
jgi:hypothetical protein